MQNDHYAHVINDLQERFDQRINELKQRDAQLKALASALESLRLVIEASEQSLPASFDSNGPFAGISVRWAILFLLAEKATEPMTTGQIAEALLTGGIITKGANFNANVSAVISNMARDRGEVVGTDGHYEITAIGRESWTGIKASPQMQGRIGSSEDKTL